jgi:hypothetical protein
VSAPASATFLPPLTGASSTITPRSAAAAASSRHVSGRMVEWIATTVPASAPARIPDAPQTTSRTSSSAHTQTPTMSLMAATAAGDDATSTFAAVAHGASASNRRAHNTIGQPASTIRVTIAPPMSPTPMKPIVAVVTMRS